MNYRITNGCKSGKCIHDKQRHNNLIDGHRDGDMEKERADNLSQKQDEVRKKIHGRRHEERRKMHSEKCKRQFNRKDKGNSKHREIKQIGEKI